MKLLMYLGMGTLLMLLLNFLRKKQYGFRAGQVIAVTVLLTGAGVLGTMVLYLLENGFWGGQSFFGAIFLVPVLFVPVALAMHIPYGKLMDYCAPAECAMLALMKYRCFVGGCCGGMVMGYTDDFVPIFFPSQLVEMVSILVVMVVLLVLERSQKNADRIYPWYMILYGVTRFVWNSFRWEQDPFVWILPPGHFWSIISVVIGVIALILLSKKRGRKNEV